MPMLDMPLDQLQAYKGRRKLPEDFDAFWNHQIERAKNHPLVYTRTPVLFKNKHIECFDLTFKAFDQATIYAKYMRPAHPKKVPVMLTFHMYGGASRSWHHLARYCALGYGVLAMDCRGQGGKSEDIGSVKGPTVCDHILAEIEDEIANMYYTKVYTDALLLSYIATKLDGLDADNMITSGNCQGGAIALALAALNPKVRKCSAQYPILADFQRVWDMDLDCDLYEGLRYHFRWFDPMHARVDAFFNKLAYIDVVNFAHRIHCPLLIGTGLLDTKSPPSTQYAIINNARCPKKHIIFAKYGHELINFFDDENLKFIASKYGS